MLPVDPRDSILPRTIHRVLSLQCLAVQGENEECGHPALRDFQKRLLEGNGMLLRVGWPGLSLGMRLDRLSGPILLQRFYPADFVDDKFYGPKVVLS